MDNRDFSKEIDEIKKNLQELADMVKENVNKEKFNFSTHFNNMFRDLTKTFEQFKSAPGNAENKEETDSDNAEKPSENNQILFENIVLTEKIVENLIKKREMDNNTGYVSYCGTFAAGNRESEWLNKGINTDDLLKLIEDKSAVKVLNCIGNSLRLDILLAILKQPMTVAQLVEHFGSNSTGQIYHHLGPLISADLIVEDIQNKGVYVVQPHRVQGIIMMLAGIQDMIDTEYSEGDWSLNID